MADTLISLETHPHALRWTREDCTKLEAAGFLNYRYELIEGMIIKLGQNMPHSAPVMLILEWAVQWFSRSYVVTQTPIDVRPEENPTNEPMPDVLILTRPSTEFTERPQPSEIRLLIEAADSTVRYDLTTKAFLYARAGIVEYWVVSLPDRALTAHRRPQNGQYLEVITYQENEQIAPLTVPDNPVLVSRLLTPQVGQTETAV